MALADVTKSIGMFRLEQINVPILGLVENMSSFIAPDTGNRYDIFGSGGAREKAAELEVPLLGELPINTQIRTCGDQGGMAQLFEDDTTRPHLEGLVCELARNLAERAKDSPSLPSLTVL
mgnify:CR=1 FL=1